MKRVFGAKKDKEPPPSVQDTSDRITKRGDNVEEKIKKLDAELARYKEQIKRTRPGPAQEAVKARAMRVLKQRRMYEGQRDMLYNQTFNLDQVAFAAEGIKDAQQTGKVQGLPRGAFSVTSLEPAAYLLRGRRTPHLSQRRKSRCLVIAYMSALKSANKDLKGMMKTVNIQDVDVCTLLLSLQDEMMDLMDVSSEIQESLGRSYNLPDDIDEDELLGELDALEADMGFETEGGVPSYLQPDKESDLEGELNFPSAPTGPGRVNMQAEDELGLPAVPGPSLRN
ncbi:hypothetical protein SASPL_136755 [Salvia splendens]|uniref:Charged multivesicular body protein 5 n=1 Tax=Salvia splendens TaxID=180675 RepID=A0A8X8X2T3_SALSN|nr:hypothetical protein SASPL_136755 [Salvia splendens]